jgi:hypothetical protein
VWALLALSLCLCLLVPLLTQSKMGEAHGYTDHRRYAFAAYAATERGWRVYREPLTVWGAGLDFPFPLWEWPDVPVPHPPGVLLFFLPVALVARHVPMGEPDFGRLLVAWVIFWTHVAMAMAFAALRVLPPGARAMTGAVVWMVLVVPAVHGFPDAMWFGFGALLIRELALRRPERALAFFVPAMLTSYRSVVLVPLAMAALLDVLRSKPPARWPWPLLAVLAAASATVLVLFHWLSQFPMARREPPLLLQPGEVSLWVTLGLAALSVAAARLAKDVVLAATMLAVCALALVDAAYWWHSVVVLAVPLAVGVRGTTALAATRISAAAWALAAGRAGFHAAPFAVIRVVRTFIGDHGAP